MSGGSNIRAIGHESAQDAQTQTSEITEEEPLALDDSWEEDWVEESVSRPRFDWVIPATAALAIAGWTGFFGWTFREPMMSGGSAADWVIWVVNWSVPVMLIGVAYLLAMRNSRKEAHRFADTAALLSQEASELETRLQVVNRELSLAREFLGSQSRDLESLGRIASERLSTHAEELQSLITTNGDQVESIANVSDTALSNMQKLRDDLPVIANSARDVSNQVGNAGRTAHEQLDKLVAGFERLNEFGQASERQVASLSKRVDTTLATFDTQLERVGKLTTSRFETLKERSDEFRSDLDAREVDVLAAMHQRVEELRNNSAELREQITSQEEQSFAALNSRKDKLEEELVALSASLDAMNEDAVSAAGDRLTALESSADAFDEKLSARGLKFSEAMAQRQDAFEAREVQAGELLAQRLAELDDALDERRSAQTAETERLVEHSERLIARVGELNELFDQVIAQSKTAEATLGSGIQSVQSRLGESQHLLNQTGSTLDGLTESSIRLLEIIQSGAHQSGKALPAAIDAAARSLSGFEERALLLSDTMDEARTRGDSLSQYMIATQAEAAKVGDAFDEVSNKLSEQTHENRLQIEALRDLIAETGREGDRLSEMTRTELKEAIGELVTAAKAAFATIDNDADAAIARSADRIGNVASEAIGRAMQNERNIAVEELEAAAARASGLGREVAVQLRDQLAKVNELAGNLELRVNRTRELAEEQVDNDFSRRMALITDSLNSNAIDITKALSHEVTDTAWASYLKGDRGIFTRRAVNLIDNAEAREIVDLYESDTDFREHVSRYIHDFEAMLRSVLSTRDGNALGVTVLGSDMGKLYVALAQAIERLRN